MLSNSLFNCAAVIVPPTAKSVVLNGCLFDTTVIVPLAGAVLNVTVPVDAVSSVVSFISYAVPPPVKETVGEVVYPVPPLVTVMPVIMPLLTVAVAVALEPPPPDKTTVGATV